MKKIIPFFLLILLLASCQKDFSFFSVSSSAGFLPKGSGHVEIGQ